MWNSFVFLSTYAKIYHWTPKTEIEKSKALIDQWLLSITQKLIQDVENAMESYDLSKAVEPFVQYIEALTNWYIRRCRTRFWADADTPDRREAFATLYTVLLDLTKIAAPFLPFIAEAIYQELKTKEMEESVHLCLFPSYNKKLRNEELEKEVAAAQSAVGLGHSLRKEYKLKVRQPLSKAYLISSNSELLDSLKKQTQLIADELNVKEICFDSDETKFVQWVAKPNFPVLGKKIGKLIPLAQKVITGFDRKQILTLASGQNLIVKIGDMDIEIEPGDVQIERKVNLGVAAGNEGDLTVALDTELNDDLLEEGLAREIVNKINTMRKEMDFQVTDRIKITIESTDRLRKCFNRFENYITHEVLAVHVQFGPCEGQLQDLNGEEAKIELSR